jgi:hypothetical protein
VTYSAPSLVAENGTHEGYQTQSLVMRGKHMVGSERHVKYLEGAYWAVLSRLAPGGYLLPHRDKGPYYTRTHIPLEPAGWYWDELGGAQRFDVVGQSYRVNHHRAHAVWNDSDTYRTTLVIDREPVEGNGSFKSYPTTICPELVTWLDERLTDGAQ